MPNIVPCYIYFYHLDKFCVLPTYPETIADNMPSKFTEQNALARSAPVFSYNNSGPRQVQITLNLHRDLMNDINYISNLKDNVVNPNGEDYIDTLIRYLQAASVPKYNSYTAGAKAVIPPMVAVRFGNTIFVKGVITSGVNCVWKKPIMVGDKYALCDITFSVCETEPYDADTIAQEGSFRGLTKMFKDGIYASSSQSVTQNVKDTAITTKPKSKLTSRSQTKPIYISS